MGLNNIRSIITIVCIISTRARTGASQSDNSTKALCGLQTDELLKHYGYNAERHIVTTEDGYILTLFRCTSNNITSSNHRKPLMIGHGLLSSSDDYCISQPHQALAYVLANAGYDVWLPNHRGTLYSRKHISKDPDDPFGDFWNFSWFEIGIYDHPAIIDYVLKVTNNSKLYYVGHSQGTTSLMVLLSERPEYNEKIHAASLMAPAAYMNHSGALFQNLGSITPILQLIQNTEVLPRSRLLNGFINSMCANSLSACTNLLDFLAGPSVNQRNDTMMPAILCHIPSGASLKQFIHYGQQVRFGFFGKYMDSNEIPADFQLNRIRIPMYIHYSADDAITNAANVETLLPKLNRSQIYIQFLNGTQFNHFDFIWGKNTAKLVYSKILKFFDSYKN